MSDLISREAAIDACIRVRELRAYDEIEEIKALPSAQPEQQWIPVTERLPEKPVQVLVYAMNTHFSIAKYKEIRKCVNEYVYTWVTDNAFDVPHEVKNVLAWMPLSEPYKEEI